ncbi:heavy metal-responsive transcriptional regulator [Sinomonas sp. ASV322]|uniref:heavy metal-responsive transcriptional regulator n=1 Tax=Sinomonas sp. ASV322 TaxID=3041920 RepID=UPI0027DB5DEA|nr:heavy metal-responsive transcriptional regulator [Sinomonas sp. ASV322]MDQ4501349.1 heavy metal-responsive transcriptional regulator [Sinomonas sp. ASV322]
MHIAEAAHAAGTTAKTLRFYEDIGLLPDVDRTPSGYRDYSPESIQRAAFIRRSRASGLSLEQTRGVLAIHDAGAKPCDEVREQLADQLRSIDARIAELQSLRHAVATQLAASASGPAECASEEICSYL